MQNKGYKVTHLEYHSKFKPAEHTIPEKELDVSSILTCLFFIFCISYFIAGFFIDWKDVL